MNRKFTILNASLPVLLCLCAVTGNSVFGQTPSGRPSVAAKESPAVSNGLQSQQPAAGNTIHSQSSGDGVPDLSGVWSAPFVPDLAKPLGHQPPFTPYGADRFAKVDHLQEPMAKCLPIGPGPWNSSRTDAVSARAVARRGRHSFLKTSTLFGSSTRMAASTMTIWIPRSGGDFDRTF